MAIHKIERVGRGGAGHAVMSERVEDSLPIGAAERETARLLTAGGVDDLAAGGEQPCTRSNRREADELREDEEQIRGSAVLDPESAVRAAVAR